VDPVVLTKTIGRPREEIFDYLADVANWAEFTDHFLVDWHLTREDSYGQGAGARFRVKRRMDRFSYGEITFVEAEEPRRLLSAGRGGRYNRVRSLTIVTLEPAGGGTLLRLSTESDPVTPADTLLETLTLTRLYTRRRWARALRRLRAILEQGEQRGARVTVAGGARKPATGFRM
jgi:hypothetical protein